MRAAGKFSNKMVAVGGLSSVKKAALVSACLATACGAARFPWPRSNADLLAEPQLSADAPCTCSENCVLAGKSYNVSALTM